MYLDYEAFNHVRTKNPGEKYVYNMIDAYYIIILVFILIKITIVLTS